MKRTLLLLLAACLAASAFAQKENPLLWHSGNTSIKLGGFIWVTASADFNGALPANDFVVSSIPVPKKWDEKSRFGLDAAASRLNLEVVQKTEGVGDVKFFFEMDFRGASDVLRLRQAYLSFMGLTVGQTWSLLYDPLATAPTADIQGVNSRTFCRTPLISYSRSLGGGFNFAAAIEYPKVKAATATGVKSVSQRIPDFPIYLQYRGSRGHLKLATVFRGMSDGDTENQKVENKFGWGVQLGGSLRVAKPITIYGQGIYGRGIARYINDLAVLSVDLMPDYEQQGRMTALPMYSFSAGVRADLSSKFYASANFGTVSVDDDADYTKPEDYHRGYYAAGAIFWKAFRNMTIATEYLYGQRDNMNKAKGSANRVELLFRYDF